MRVDAIRIEDEFSAALLDPARAVPSPIKNTPEKRYAVYRNNVTISLIRAMEANFPAVQRLLGEAYFAGLARDFVQAHPPAHPLMFLYGETFPQYLTGIDDLAEFPYLSDVAKVEQLWRRSYHGVDAGLLSPAAFGAFSEEEINELCFVAHPALFLFQSRYAACSIFQANRNVAGTSPVDPDKAEMILITRPQFDVQLRSVSAGAFAFLQALTTGNCLGDAAEQGATADPDFNFAAAFQLMLVAGAFQSVVL